LSQFSLDVLKTEINAYLGLVFQEQFSRQLPVVGALG
jgi:hypothetical protein